MVERTVQHRFSRGITIVFTRDGACWREQRSEQGRLRSDEGLVDLERVLAVVEGFEGELAKAFDPNGASRLAQRSC
jgi:hypothetical protein